MAVPVASTPLRTCAGVSCSSLAAVPVAAWLQVLTSQGTPEQPDVRLCRLTDIQRKVNYRQKPVTQDQYGNQVGRHGKDLQTNRALWFC